MEPFDTTDIAVPAGGHPIKVGFEYMREVMTSGHMHDSKVPIAFDEDACPCVHDGRLKVPSVDLFKDLLGVPECICTFVGNPNLLPCLVPDTKYYKSAVCVGECGAVDRKFNP